jgi:hypothetical protein
LFGCQNGNRSPADPPRLKVDPSSAVIDAVLAGLVAGYSIAIPVGPMATYLLALAARTSVRVGAAAALGVATVDGNYALAATLGGAAAGDAVQPTLGVLHWRRARWQAGRWTAIGSGVLMGLLALAIG